MITCKTVGELITALEGQPKDQPIASLYDWGADVKYGIAVRGAHTCGDDCDKFDCSLAGHVILDIDPRPT